MRKLRKRIKIDRWTPLEKISDLTPEEAQLIGARETWGNNRYQVFVNHIEPNKHRGDLPMVHLSIKRLDRKPIRDWRDLQRIKDELVGTDAEGVEIYPSQARLIDGANQHHIFCIPPGQVFPFGFEERSVTDNKEESLKQMEEAGLGEISKNLEQRERKPWHTAEGCTPNGKVVWMYEFPNEE
jgi:hypothetical protein